MSDEKQMEMKISEQFTFVEGPVDPNGLITSMTWTCGKKHGSFLLIEPYRSGKTAEEIHTIGMSNLKALEIQAI